MTLYTIKRPITNGIDIITYPKYVFNLVLIPSHFSYEYDTYWRSKEYKSNIYMSNVVY